MKYFSCVACALVSRHGHVMLLPPPMSQIKTTYALPHLRAQRPSTMIVQSAGAHIKQSRQTGASNELPITRCRGRGVVVAACCEGAFAIRLCGARRRLYRGRKGLGEGGAEQPVSALCGAAGRVRIWAAAGRERAAGRGGAERGLRAER